MKTLPLFVLTMFLATACSSSAKQEDAKPAKKQPQKPTGASEDAVEGDSDSDGLGQGNAGGSDNDGASTSGCRKFQDAFQTTTKVEGPVKVPILGSVNISIDADAAVKINSGETSGTLAIEGRVTAARPALAKATAERGLSAYGDPMKLKYLTTSEQNSLSGWDGLDCQTIGVTSLKSSNFDYTFEPALPLLVPAKPNGDGFSRTISGIKSTIRAHFEEKNGAKPGTYEGRAVLSQKGQTFHITYDFGQGVPKVFAAPFAEIEYQIGDDGKFSNITAWIWISATDKLPVSLAR